MIINSIELQNIRSYDNERIEFPRGITLFEGDIGSGKSTILMGIEFALFGLGSQKPESLLSKKANDGCVVLNFEVKGQKCEVKRALKRKGQTLSQDPKNTYLKINDEMEPLSPTELKQKILQILNFNEPGDPRSESRIYRYAIFTPQEEMKNILYDSTKRLETIRKAFGVEDYKIAVENSKEIIRTLHEKSIVFMERFRDADKYESELKKSSEIICKIEAENIEALRQEEEKESMKKKLVAELDSMKERKQEQRDCMTNKKNIEAHIHEKNEEQQKIASQIRQTSEDLKELAKELDQQKRISKPTSRNIDEINQKIREFTELNKTISNLEYRKTLLAEDMKKIRAKLNGHEEHPIDELNMRLKNIMDAKIESQKRYEAFQIKIRTMQKEEAKLESEKEINEKSMLEASKLGAKCPHCEHELTEEHKQKLEIERKKALNETKNRLEKIVKERNKHESEMAGLESAISEAENEIKAIKDIIPDLESLAVKNREFAENEHSLKQALIQNVVPDGEPSIHAATEEPVAYFTALKDALQSYHNAEIRTSNIEREIVRLDKSKSQNEHELEAKSIQIKQLEEELARNVERLKMLSDVDERFSALEEQDRRIDSEIKNLVIVISVNKEKIEVEKKKIIELDEKILESRKWKGVHKKYTNYHDWLNKFFIPAIDKIEKQVLLSIQQNFNEVYHRWYSILIDDPTKESRVDEDFTPIVEQDGYEQDITFLSGGEKTSVALAYRLTLNSLMRQESESMRSNLLILDEPTDGFSKTQLAKVKTILSELRSEQIILVSHEKELETYVDNIFQINKNTGISKVTRVYN